jgi:GT2 family glycosyltransferase
MSRPDASVIIPSHNRRALLLRVLEGLAAQTLGTDRFEALVVLDGCTDGSSAAVEAWRARGALPSLRLLSQPQQGQATARANGADAAQAPVLVFLDDDVVPAPDLLARHLRWHAGGEPVAVLGDYHVVRSARPSLYELTVWAWWEDLFFRRSRPGRLPAYRDVCTGNLSVRRDDFLAVGGFDTAFRGYGGEDYDLGYRLLRRGVRLVADPSATAAHHHVTRPAQVLRQMRQEGANDVRLGRKHPALRRGLRLMRRTPDVRLAMQLPALCDVALGLGRGLLVLYERAGLRGRWRRLFGWLRHYAYWQGVRDGLGSWRALQTFQEEAPAAPRITLDITAGLPTTAPALWMDGPSEVEVTHRGRALGVIVLTAPLDGPWAPGLARALIEQLSPALRLALATSGDDAWMAS